MKRISFILIFLSSQVVAQVKTMKQNEISISQQVWSLTEVMYHDVVNPPAAARFYAYSVLTGYEILSQLDSTTPLFQRLLKAYPVFETRTQPLTVNKELAVLYGILETGKNIIPSGYLLEEKQEQLINGYKDRKIATEIIDSTVAFAKTISRQIVQYAKSDGYFQLSTRIRYTPFTADSCWRPTPPEYMAAVEPHWRTIRTFLLDSSQQCKPIPAVCFDTSNASAFMRLTKEVYTVSQQLNDEQKLIANFWDCNPFAVQFQGHMSIGLKKISPGGHWMGITGIVCKKAKLDFNSTMLLHILVALTLHDAFASCWDEKYRSNRIRPETAINRYVDPKWKPLLQTPPFPEYSSGHSVISTAVAELLTHFLGGNFSFTDSTETYIGLPERTFTSFRAAAAEARISRLYGGIHFRDAIENGGEQGKRVGEFIINKLKLAPILK
ncbi:MAG TPA: vanadium-dependent haloperoxidase [Chitinophagaceae bacterium]